MQAPLLNFFLRKSAHYCIVSPMAQPMTPGVPEWRLQDRLTRARDAAGLTQRQLADEIGIGLRSVSNYEQGSKTPRRPVLVTWALRCGVLFDWLAYGIEATPGPDGGSVSGEQSRACTSTLGRIPRRPRLIPRSLPVAA